jgi:hypothetical protein
MVVLMSQGMLGAGAFGKTPLSLQIRTIGGDNLKVVKFPIQNARRAPGRTINGKYHPNAAPPYFVDQADKPFHYGANSICYALQWGLLMGADPIYLMGFTLQSGTAYEFGSTNPATKRASTYNIWRAIEWCGELEKRWPGRVRLLPGWKGPIYDVFPVDAPKARVTVPWQT